MQLRVAPLVCSIDIYKSWSNRSLVCLWCNVGDFVFDMCLEVVSNLLYAYVVNAARMPSLLRKSELCVCVFVVFRCRQTSTGPTSQQY